MFWNNLKIFSSFQISLRLLFDSCESLSTSTHWYKIWRSSPNTWQEYNMREDGERSNFSTIFKFAEFVFKNRNNKGTCSYEKRYIGISFVWKYSHVVIVETPFSTDAVSDKSPARFPEWLEFHRGTFSYHFFSENSSATIFEATRIGKNPASCWRKKSLRYEWGSYFPARIGKHPTKMPSWGKFQIDRKIILPRSSLWIIREKNSIQETLYIEIKVSTEAIDVIFKQRGPIYLHRRGCHLWSQLDRG